MLGGIKSLLVPMDLNKFDPGLFPIVVLSEEIEMKRVNLFYSVRLAVSTTIQLHSLLLVMRVKLRSNLSLGSDSLS